MEGFWKTPTGRKNWRLDDDITVNLKENFVISGGKSRDVRDVLSADSSTMMSFFEDRALLVELTMFVEVRRTPTVLKYEV